MLGGIDAALNAGLKLKINMVALRGVNDDEIPAMMEWAHSLGMDMTLIETMPMGDVDDDRVEHYMPLSLVRAQLTARNYAMEESALSDRRSGLAA